MNKKLSGIIVFITLVQYSIAQVDTSAGSFYQVYSKVFAVSCAVPACHDGSFEPDFRTPQSAYYTTVYQPVIKNNAANQFMYRVVPFDNINSLVQERTTKCCFVNNNDRMPLSSDTLTEKEILLISNWISQGAKDLCGNSPPMPR